MKRLTRVFAIMKKEFLHVMRDKVMFSIVFLAPILFTCLFGFLYINGKVTQVPIVIFDQNQSEISRSLVRAFGDSEKFKIVGMIDSYSELERIIKIEKAYMGVVIPVNLQQKIKSGRSTEVGIVINGSNILVMNTVANAANQVVQTISARVTMQIMQGYGISKDKAYQAVTVVNFRTRIWYNPTLSYLNFMLLGLLAMLVQQLSMLGVALAFSKERENGTFSSLIYSRINGKEIICGKLLLYFLLFAIDAIVVYWLGISYFKLPMRGNVFLLMMVMGIFLLVVLTLGMLISLFSQNMSQAIQFSMLVAVPSFLLSGYTWPAFSMPIGLQFLSKLMPLTYFLEATRALILMGGDWAIIKPFLSSLLIFLLVLFPSSIYMVQRKLHHN